jgi:hypothetical protein
MSATRITLALIAAGPLLAAILVWHPPTAHADEHEPGVSDIVCQLLALGESPLEIAKQLQGGRPDISRLSATETVFAAARWCGPTFER